MFRFVIDPVCQMEIRPDQAVAVTRFEGHRIYFCSDGCYAEFLDIPHSYVDWDDRPNRDPKHRGRRLDPRYVLSDSPSDR
jgi:YHS domain-containing protein